MSNLFQKVFGREETASGNREFIDEMKERYPYFGLAHFYSLKERSGNDEFQQAAPKASLYFNDLFLLNGLLKAEHKTEEINNPVTETEPAAIINQQEELIEETPAAEDNSIPEEVTIQTQAPEDILITEKSAEETPEAPAQAASFLRPNDFAVENVSSPVNNEPLFEPLHATDYFLSQGIKLSENVLGNDKLGQQLKSFTAWLKTMKKANTEKLPQVSAAVEAAVQNMAEKSNIEADVVTEAMAEVYAQQGKPDKAIETYGKLSLLNPSKSAYFAAKIELLK